ncbi:MAG: GIY-YIG nuclease family protein [Hyphomonadaceae bacterium]|nr:GIY-YIG nuclease family protein [Hyphomonadaceae bacterium]
MREEAGGWIYILASGRNGTLYTGSTRNLIARVARHRDGLGCEFTRKYGVTRLVWFEAHDSIAAAYHREQLIKRWRRAWKIALIEEKNPFWDDLFLPLSNHTLPGRRPRGSGAESRDPR